MPTDLVAVVGVPLERALDVRGIGHAVAKHCCPVVVFSIVAPTGTGCWVKVVAASTSVVALSSVAAPVVRPAADRGADGTDRRGQPDVGAVDLDARLETGRAVEHGRAAIERDADVELADGREEDVDVAGRLQPAIRLGNDPPRSSCRFADGEDPCTDMPTAPAPSASLQLDLGNSLPAIVGLSTTGTFDVRFVALGQFDIGIPLNGSTPVLYGTTGLEARVEVNGTNLGVVASIGPVNAALGSGAGGTTGVVDEDSTSTLVDNEATFTGQLVPVDATIENTTTGEECFASALTDGQHVECALQWHVGDGYRDRRPGHPARRTDLRAQCRRQQRRARSDGVGGHRRRRHRRDRSRYLPRRNRRLWRDRARLRRGGVRRQRRRHQPAGHRLRPALVGTRRSALPRCTSATSESTSTPPG